MTIIYTKYKAENNDSYFFNPCNNYNVLITYPRLPDFNAFLEQIDIKQDIVVPYYVTSGY